MKTARPNYYNQHLMKMQSRIIIPKGDLQKGMVVSNLYETIQGDKNKYMFLILNPVFQGKVHVLNLNEFSTIHFNNLAKDTGIVEIIKYKKRALDIPKLIMEESSRRFYIGKLRQDLKRFYNNSYRTLFLNKMGMIQLIDYDFDDDVAKR
jgi:hypothetical protein|tara:strand:+ start:798 stop:1247 length:450 start_codon:yes stop_codon:yes gene_type:complete